MSRSLELEEVMNSRFVRDLASRSKVNTSAKHADCSCKVKYPGSVPTPLIRQLTTAYNFNPRQSHGHITHT